MKLLAAPQVAGLLPAQVTQRPAVLCYTSDGLSTLPEDTRAHLSQAVTALLDTAVDCIHSTQQPWVLDRAAQQFATEIKSLLPQGILHPAPSLSRTHYRTREEMDAELHTIVANMHERIATIRSEVRHG